MSSSAATLCYSGGLESLLTVRDAQRSLHAADGALVDSDWNLALSMICVYKSPGGRWQLERAARQSTRRLEGAAMFVSALVALTYGLIRIITRRVRRPIPTDR